MPLRAMTWNLWWRFGAWEQREPAIIDVIRAADPDVLCLQEVWSTPNDSLAERIADQLGWTFLLGTGVGRSGVGFSNALVSRWPLSLLADEPLPGHDGAPGHRRVVAATAATPWGAWPIASTHFDHRFDASLSRQRQATRLAELAVEWRGDPTSDLPVIVGADLNATPDSDEVRLLTGRRDGVEGIVFSDVWEHVGDGTGATWSRSNPNTGDSAWPERRLDYILVSWPRPKPVGNPVSAHLVGTCPTEIAGTEIWPSDHAAVVAELVTPD